MVARKTNAILKFSKNPVLFINIFYISGWGRESKG